MNRPPAIVWLFLLLLLLPTAAGRILIDVVGGVALVLVAVVQISCTCYKMITKRSGGSKVSIL